jgi:cobalamin biosynthesis protein CobD/CbiB
VAARLGDVLYWLGCILAVLFLPLPLLALIDFLNGHPQTIFHPEYLIGAAILSWLTGRTLGYVFAGT